jgi:serine/threonine protein kinase
MVLLNSGDIVYLAIKGMNFLFPKLILLFQTLGEDFSYTALLDDYNIVSELGQGGFGKVMLGKHKEEKKEVAIKFMDISDNFNSATMIQEVYKEAESLKKLTHKNIIALYHAFVEGKQLIMIMEYASGGELLKFIEEKGKLRECDARRIFL